MSPSRPVVGDRGALGRRVRLRRLAATAALGMVALACGLGMAELLVRWLAPQVLVRYPRGFFIPDASRSYRLAPGFRGIVRGPGYRTAVALNARGWRGPEIAAAHPGLLRLLVLGDSYTFGVGVGAEETFPAVLQPLLAADRPVEVVNAGVPSYATSEQAITLKREGLALRPDAVLVVFFIGNDVTDNVVLHRWRVRHGLLTSQVPAPLLIPSALRAWLARTSHLYTLVRHVPGRLLGFEDQAQRQLARQVALYRLDDPPDAQRAFAATATWIGRLARTLAAHRLPGAALIVPEPMQVDPDAWRSTLARVGEDPSRVARRHPNDRVRALFAAVGLPVLDLFDVFGGDGTTRSPYYLPRDGHWTAEGNRLVAAAVARWLHEVGMLASEGRLSSVRQEGISR